MNNILITLLSSVVVFHAVGRLAGSQSAVVGEWRERVVSVSVLLELIGAAAAMGEAMTGAHHVASVLALLAALATMPLADCRRKNNEAQHEAH